MKTRIIWTKIWEDDWFQSLDDPAQKLFYYLITNRIVNLCGCYQISDFIIKAQTRIKDLEKAKNNLLPKVRFFKDWVYILNAQWYGGYIGEKLEKALEKEKNEIPNDVKDVLFSDKYDRVSIEYRGGIDTPINNKSKLINNNIKETNKYNILSNISDDVLIEVSNEYNVTIEYLKQKIKDIDLYCQRTGKSYKNYKAVLQTWVRGDIEKGKARFKPRVVETVMPNIMKPKTPEEIENSNKKLQEIRDRLHFTTDPKNKSSKDNT